MKTACVEIALTEIERLSLQLAIILESLEQMQQKEKPYLLAVYQINLGELEYRLLELQVECRALQQRIELATAKLNRGEVLTQPDLDEFERQVQQLLSTAAKPTHPKSILNRPSMVSISRVPYRS